MAEARTTATGRKTPSTPAKKAGATKTATPEAKTTASTRPAVPGTAENQITHQAAYKQYQAALEFLQQNRFEKALAAFEHLLNNAPPELIERCRVYIVACKRQIEATQLTFSSTEEQYDYAISLLNKGLFEDARDQFTSILAERSEADFAYYGLALLDSITGQVFECLEHLGHAIELNPRNRYQARTDPDFQGMADDPRFTELLYPEVL